jgi:hypothetical protein
MTGYARLGLSVSNDLLRRLSWRPVVDILRTPDALWHDAMQGVASDLRQDRWTCEHRLPPPPDH